MRGQWTVETIKEHFTAIIADRDVRIGLALSANKEAVEKAEAAVNERLKLLNEFRGQLSDQASKYALTDLVNQQNKEFDGRIGRVENAVSSLQGRALALVAIGAVVGAIASAVVVQWIK